VRPPRATAPALRLYRRTNKENHMKTTRWAMPLLATLALALATSPTRAAPVLGTQLTDFAVLGAAAVTNTGNTQLKGALGVSNNSSVSGMTGFFGTLANDGPGTASGAVHQGDPYALAADQQLSIAMSSLSLMGAGTALGASLGGLTLVPGVYTVSAAASNLVGTLTLDGGGNANAYWVFQMDSTLITSVGSNVNVINSGAGAGVFWNVGSSATLDSGSTFMGNILASASITMNDHVTLSCGRALAHVGAVTLIGDTIDGGSCLGTGASGSAGLSGGLTMPELGGLPTALPYLAVTNVPEPGPSAMYLAGLASLLLLRRKPKA
jgi:hypothetical protein